MFDIERAAFGAVSQRIEKPGSDLACIRWLRDVYASGFEGLDIQHLYRAMDIVAEHKEEMDYIVGIPLRRYVDILEEVLSDPQPFQEVADNLHVKEVIHTGLRYVVCHNPHEAERDRRARESIVERLQEILSSQGPKALVGNRGYQKFLKMDRKSVILDEAKIASEARFDGIFVLLTNCNLPTEEVATSYKNLWQVERAFSDLKNILEVRPVYHRRQKRIKGHIFCNFLALYLKIALQKTLESKNLKFPWGEVTSDLRALRAVKLHLNGSTYLSCAPISEA